MNLIFSAYLANQLIDTQRDLLKKEKELLEEKKKKLEDEKIKEVSKSESTNKDKDETKGQNVDISV